jgi:plasmid maintenance system antidote protein VapI
MEGFYEEKVFDGELYFRTTPGGAYRKKPVEKKFRGPKPPRVKKEKPPKQPKIIPPKHPVDVMLNVAQVKLNLPTRASVHRKLKVTAPTVSRIRNGTARVTSDIILRFYDATGMSIEEIRKAFNVPTLIINATLPASRAATTEEVK